MSRRPYLSRFVAAAALAACCSEASAQTASRRPVATAGRTAAVIPNIGDKSRSQRIDIALDEDRTLRGRFVDSTGAPVDGAVVTLRQADRVIARSTTLADGTFEIQRVPSGAYRLACGSASGTIRCWSADAAPPHAVADGVTFQDNVVRGQAGLMVPALFGTSAVTTAAVSGTAIGGVAVYAASEAGSSGGLTSTAATDGGTPLGPEGPPLRPANSFAGEVVGRDIHGNLIRLRGDAPWEQGDRYNGGIRPPNDTSEIVLPNNGSALTEDAPLPASP